VTAVSEEGKSDRHVSSRLAIIYRSWGQLFEACALTDRRVYHYAPAPRHLRGLVGEGGFLKGACLDAPSRKAQSLFLSAEAQGKLLRSYAQNKRRALLVTDGAF